MTRQKACRTVALSVIFSLSGPLVAQAQAPLDTEESKILYALGVTLSQNLDTFNLTADELQFLNQGLADGVLAREHSVDIQEYGPKLQTFAEQRVSAVMSVAKTEGEQFLQQMAAEEGSTRMASGLVSTEIVPGTGATPTATDTVTVHYHGTFTDGSVFDSSAERGEPASFALNQVIPCWTEGLQLMQVGGKNRIICPSEIAYGDQGRPGIPPAAVLVFEIELLAIE
jgi:FKBP-type peptidyl-prolyl cis-trans isomerase FkpA/FKBP-type peptidyl-prolyl cis-trans isomerase FklB